MNDLFGNVLMTTSLLAAKKFCKNTEHLCPRYPQCFSCG